MPQSKKDHRRAERFPYCIPTSVRHPRTTSRAMGVTGNLSQKGVFFFFDTRVEPGSAIELIMIMPPEIPEFAQRWVCCNARVVRVEERPGEKQVGIAAEITRCEALPEIQGW
ncbi:MAG TPA: PilZ domain-containing protein [Terriglobales bacterium]|nr:PilZ domain-containing protein [Terriglobales bacterium]